MTLVQLSYIVALDKFKNFGQAAEDCGVTQPTLSMQVQKLEEDLGIILFDRTQQPVKTTKLGEELISQAKVILSEAQKFQAMVKDDKNEIKGEFHLAIIPTLAPYLLPLFIKKFREQFKDLQISIYEMQTHEIIENLKNNKIDMGLLVTPIEDEKLKTYPLFYEPFTAYVSDKSSLIRAVKVSQTDLNSNELWLLSEGHCFRDQTLALCKNRKKMSDESKNIRFESGSLETLKKMVDEEGGVTLMPYLATLDLPQNKHIKEFSNPVPTREVSLICSHFFRRTKLVKELTKSIQSVLPKSISVIPTKNSQVVSLPIGKPSI